MYIVQILWGATGQILSDAIRRICIQRKISYHTFRIKRAHPKMCPPGLGRITVSARAGQRSELRRRQGEREAAGEVPLAVQVQRGADAAKAVHQRAASRARARPAVGPVAGPVLPVATVAARPAVALQRARQGVAARVAVLPVAARPAVPAVGVRGAGCNLAARVAAGAARQGRRARSRQ